MNPTDSCKVRYTFLIALNVSFLLLCSNVWFWRHPNINAVFLTVIHDGEGIFYNSKKIIILFCIEIILNLLG